jgi:pyrophosphatase PpaX
MVIKKPLLCFDLDGTILDSIDAHVEAYKIALKKNNVKFPGKAKLVANFGEAHGKILKKLFPKMSDRKLKKILADNKEARKETFHMIKAYPHVLEALLKLKKHFKIGIVSNSYHDNVYESLEIAKIPTKLFDVIIGEDDAKPKPSPAEILLAEKLTKADAKYMVGDTIFDIKAGKKANCKTIAIISAKSDFNKLMKAKPDILASSVAILPDILLNK